VSPLELDGYGPSTGGASKPRRRAATIASSRVCTPSSLNMLRTWLRTVSVDSVSFFAMSEVDRPEASRLRISRWRGVSRGKGARPMGLDAGGSHRTRG